MLSQGYGRGWQRQLTGLQLNSLLYSVLPLTDIVVWASKDLLGACPTAIRRAQARMGTLADVLRGFLPGSGVATVLQPKPLVTGLNVFVDYSLRAKSLAAPASRCRSC